MNKTAFLSQFHHFQINREQHFAPKLYKALQHQYSQFITAKKHGLSNQHALEHVTSASIYTVLKAIYKDSVHYGSLVYSQLPKAPKKLKRRAPIGFNEEMIALVNDYFDSDILNFSEGITDTTKEAIQVILQIANEEGRSLDWIVNNMETETDLNRSRSRLIARTETVTSTNQAGHLAAAKTGLLMNKEWLSAEDSRVRPAHAEANGHTVGFEDYFHVGGETLLVPGARIQENGLPTSPENVCNCRCCSLNVAVRDERGRLIEHDYGVFSELASL